MRKHKIKLAQHCTNCDRIIGTKNPNRTNLCSGCLREKLMYKNNIKKNNKNEQ